MPHMHTFYRIFEGLNEIMYVNRLAHCLAHGRRLKNVFSLLHVLYIKCWVKHKVLLAWQSLFCLSSALLLNVWLPDAFFHKG